MSTNKKKCGGSPEEVEVIFYQNPTDIFFNSYDISDIRYRDRLLYANIEMYKVKIGTTYKDVLIRFLNSSIGLQFKNNDDILFYEINYIGHLGQLNETLILYDLQAEISPDPRSGTIEIIVQSISLLVNHEYNHSFFKLDELTKRSQKFFELIDPVSYHRRIKTERRRIKAERERKEKKIHTLKKQLPKLLESVNEVNSINLKNFRKNNSTTSANSDTEYVDEDKIIRLSRTENNKEFISWHDKEDLVKWLKLKRTLPTSRTIVTPADIKKIEDSVGYGQLIKIGNRTSPKATTSRANEDVQNNSASTSSAASSRRTASGRSSISASNRSNAMASARASRRSSARTLPPGSPLSSRVSTNNPDGSPRPNSNRSSARTTPRASPGTMARAAAIARAERERS